jgi:VIT1/CCC1 family predicted Fe2+/Mn2+ transporter
MIERSYDREQLRREHTHGAIEQRLSGKGRGSYLRDAILGGIDGAVTTFAVIAGSLGGGFSREVALTLGLANLIADGFSMAVSNYQGVRSRQEEIEYARQAEIRQIRVFPEGERAEIRQIFERKGFTGDVLDTIVETLTRDCSSWVDTMMCEELGIGRNLLDPMRSALATFFAFIIVGLLPLSPFLLYGVSLKTGFILSIVLTAATFFVIGAVKGFIVHKSILWSGLGTFLTGAAAAFLAFAAANLLNPGKS